MPWPKGKKFSPDHIAKRSATLVARGSKAKKSLILDGLEYWKCGTCEIYRPTSEFYFDGKTASGVSSVCRQCHTASNLRTRDLDTARESNAAHMRRARAEDPEKFRARERIAGAKKRAMSAEKVAARNAVNAAVKRGNLVKPSACESCGGVSPLSGHHDDYENPLTVRWLCRKCHGKEHRHA